MEEGSVHLAPPFFIKYSLRCILSREAMAKLPTRIIFLPLPLLFPVRPYLHLFLFLPSPPRSLKEEIERADKTVTRSNVQGALNPAIKTPAHVYYFI